MRLKSLLFVLNCLVLLSIVSCTEPNVAAVVDPTTGQNIMSYNLSPTLLGALPNSVDESSGVAVYTSLSYWTHNDRGDMAILYLVDVNGVKLREFEITNSDNEDWEDLATDPERNLYVADTGNNDNDRQDLKIYIIPSGDLASSDGVADIINVSYEDQTEFPPGSDNLHFDVEATMFLNGYIYMFTRDRTMPFVGKTKLYRIEAKAGGQVAKLISEFNTETDEKDGAITGAGISPSGEVIAMVSKTRIWIFKNFDQEDFFKGDIDIFTLDTDTKIEAVDFIDDCNIILTDEKKGSRGGNLYKSNICI